MQRRSIRPGGDRLLLLDPQPTTLSDLRPNLGDLGQLLLHDFVRVAALDLDLLLLRLRHRLLGHRFDVLGAAGLLNLELLQALQDGGVIPRSHFLLLPVLFLQLLTRLGSGLLLDERECVAADVDAFEARLQHVEGLALR